MDQGRKSDEQTPATAGGCSDGAARYSGSAVRIRRRLLLGFGLALTVGVIWFFRQPLRQRIFADAVLANDAPAPDAVQTMIQQASDPRAAILAAWNTEKIVQREVAIQELSRVVPNRQPLSMPLRNMLLAAALDPDFDVRETALNTLDRRHDPALAALIAAQLSDLDPQVQMLGLMHLEHVPAQIGVPLVVPLLDDRNPQIVALALNLLEGWSGQKFGVKLVDAVPVEDPETGLEVFNEKSYKKTRAGAERAETWWAAHKMDFPAPELKIPSGTLAAFKPLYTENFSLPALNGHHVRLSAFRGKVVLINFWTTWCPACISEMPELVALQKRHIRDLKILGISLDAVSDDDRHGALPPAERIRRRVARTVASRGINYTVLLDEQDIVGGRFNGGELPTTVIVDALGRIRRRFIGGRSLSVFEAMVAEASKPMRSIRAAYTKAGATRDHPALATSIQFAGAK